MQLSFSEKLGLDPSARYVVFDFWNQRLLGVFKDHMEVDIEPHDTRVLHVHPLLAQPQLIGMSRHISGAYSVLELKWDEAKRTLRGTSQTVPGDAYVLYVYVPDGLAVAKVDGRAGQGGAVPARWQRSGDCLTITLAGQKEPIHWEITFAGVLSNGQ